MIKLCTPKCPTMSKVRKCCFCVPIRKGVTIFGYVNLVLSLLSFPVLTFMLVEQVALDKDVEPTVRIDSTAHLPITIAFLVIDVAMTVILLVGAHKKKKLLLQIYFYFGVVFQLLTVCVDFVYFDFRDYLENTVYVIFLSLNTYLLFLVYHTIHAIDEHSEVQYSVYQDQQHQSV